MDASLHLDLILICIILRWFQFVLRHVCLFCLSSHVYINVFIFPCYVNVFMSFSWLVLLSMPCWYWFHYHLSIRCWYFHVYFHVILSTLCCYVHLFYYHVWCNLLMFLFILNVIIIVNIMSLFSCYPHVIIIGYCSYYCYY